MDSIKTDTEVLQWIQVGYLLDVAPPGEWGANALKSWTPQWFASEGFKGQKFKAVVSWEGRHHWLETHDSC